MGLLSLFFITMLLGSLCLLPFTDALSVYLSFNTFSSISLFLYVDKLFSGRQLFNQLFGKLLCKTS